MAAVREQLRPHRCRMMVSVLTRLRLRRRDGARRGNEISAMPSSAVSNSGQGQDEDIQDSRGVRSQYVHSSREQSLYAYRYGCPKGSSYKLSLYSYLISFMTRYKMRYLLLPSISQRYIALRCAYKSRFKPCCPRKRPQIGGESTYENACQTAGATRSH